MKKLWLLGIAGMVLAFGLGFSAQPIQAAYTPADGDLIKIANDGAIYYIGADSKRHLYVNEATFWTWYEGSWSNIKSNGVTQTIKTLSQEDFDNLAVGQNSTAKPGAKLVKFQNSPKIYTVVSNAKLALVPDDATAKQLFGDDWNKKIITIQNGFETDYAKDGVLDLAKIDYTNNDFGFSLKFPATWSKYTVTTTVGTLGQTCFFYGFPTWSNMFAVCAYTGAQFEALQNSDSPATAKELKGENSSYKFTITHTQEVADESLMWASNDIAPIMESFKAF